MVLALLSTLFIISVSALLRVFCFILVLLRMYIYGIRQNKRWGGGKLRDTTVISSRLIVRLVAFQVRNEDEVLIIVLTIIKHVKVGGHHCQIR